MKIWNLGRMADVMCERRCLLRTQRIFQRKASAWHSCHVLLVYPSLAADLQPFSWCTLLLLLKRGDSPNSRVVLLSPLWVLKSSSPPIMLSSICSPSSTHVRATQSLLKIQVGIRWTNARKALIAYQKYPIKSSLSFNTIHFLHKNREQVKTMCWKESCHKACRNYY